MKIDVKVKRLENSNGLELPNYETEGAAAMDLLAANYDDIIISAGGTALVPTGLCIELPSMYEFQVRPRSGLALKNSVTVLNSPGTVDADYRGEIGIILINHSNKDFIVERGMRIAQGLIQPVFHANLIEVDELSDTERGSGGFGSTGVKS